MKFLTLLKKELKDIANVQNIITYAVMFLLMFSIGGLTGSISEIEDTEDKTVYYLVDQDKTALTSEITKHLKATELSVEILSEPDGQKSYVVIPKGFTEGIERGEPQSVQNVNTIESTSIMAAARTQDNSILLEQISNYIIAYEGRAMDFTANRQMLVNPVIVEPVTVARDKSAPVSVGALTSLLMSSSLIVPVIIMVLVMLSAQLIIAGVANEKTDKTLETLMSTPVSRTTVLLSKILSSAIVSTVITVVFTSIMTLSSLQGTETADTLAQAAILNQLGLSMEPLHYAFLGLNMILTILIALCLSFIMGVIAPDAKSTQMTITPIVIMVLLPYMITNFVDINSLPLFGNILLNLIPFTHTFTATNNILFGNYGLYWLGVGYQMVFLLITIFCTVKIFSSDIIFTGLKLNRNGRGRGRMAFNGFGRQSGK